MDLNNLKQGIAGIQQGPDSATMLLNLPGMLSI
jgi:hypothetical protein